MSFGNVVQDIAATSPWALVALILFGLAIVFAGGAVCLRIALRDTSEDARPGIIRELGEFVRALLGGRK
ncbi:hypothetical protein [Streptomyces eurythermus]